MLQTVLDDISSASKAESSHGVEQLTENYQSVLYYTPGFILHSVKVHLSLHQHAESLKEAVDEIIENNARYNRMFLQKFKEWSKKLNRRDLF